MHSNTVIKYVRPVCSIDLMKLGFFFKPCACLQPLYFPHLPCWCTAKDLSLYAVGQFLTGRHCWLDFYGHFAILNSAVILGVFKNPRNTVVPVPAPSLLDWETYCHRHPIMTRQDISCLLLAQPETIWDTCLSLLTTHSAYCIVDYTDANRCLDIRDAA